MYDMKLCVIFRAGIALCIHVHCGTEITVPYHKSGVFTDGSALEFVVKHRLPEAKT